jgi:nitronate monooxygenase
VGAVIDLRVPVVQAPMAGGPSTPELAAAVSNAGGLGFLAAGYLPPDRLRDQVRRTRELTGERFGVNLFVLEAHAVDDAAVAAYARELEPYGVELAAPRFDDDSFAEKVELLLGERVPVVSATFACPPPATIEALRSAGSEVWVTVTSRDEARTARDAGAGVLVAQGAEAGGHRGSWTDADGPDLPVLELLAALRDAVDLPLVAAGGIADSDAVRAVLAAGAIAAQAGTAFLLSQEAGTNEAHRSAIRSGGETTVTRAFSGRRARAIVNEFVRAHPNAPSAFPHVLFMTAPLRRSGDPALRNFLAGVNFAQANELPAAEIVARLSP